jgi:tetratricopeptide (TPR) repeat protein
MENCKIACFFFVLYSLLPLIAKAEQKKGSSLVSLDSLAFTAFKSGRLSAAENYAYRIIETEKKGSLYLVNAYTLLGIINKNRGYLISSVENYLHALKIAENLADESRISACLNNIGVIYQLQKNYKTAISYFIKSLVIEEKGSNALQRSIRYYNLAECYSKIDSLDLAISFYTNSLLIEQKHRQNEGVLYAYLGIADVYLKINNTYQTALILKKIDSKRIHVQPEIEILYYKLKGNYLLHINKPIEALIELKRAIEISNESENLSFVLEILKLQITGFESLGNSMEANKIYKKYIELNDQFSSNEVQNKIEDLNYQNQLRKKEKEIKSVQEERDIALKNTKTQILLRNFERKIMWFSFFLFSVASVMVFLGLKKVSKFNYGK